MSMSSTDVGLPRGSRTALAPKPHGGGDPSSLPIVQDCIGTVDRAQLRYRVRDYEYQSRLLPWWSIWRPPWLLVCLVKRKGWGKK